MRRARPYHCRLALCDQPDAGVHIPVAPQAAGVVCCSGQFRAHPQPALYPDRRGGNGVTQVLPCVMLAGCLPAAIGLLPGRNCVPARFLGQTPSRYHLSVSHPLGPATAVYRL